MTRKNIFILVIVILVIAAGFAFYQSQKGAMPWSAGPAGSSGGAPVSQKDLNQITGEAIVGGAKTSGCDVLTDVAQRAVCEMNVVTAQAKEKNDVSLCNQISEEGFKENCQDQFYTYDAIVKKDANICNKVINDTRKA